MSTVGFFFTHRTPPHVLPHTQTHRGLNTALIEREDFASGTSSRSTKMVHGGVRYLEKAVFHLDYDQLMLVYEGLHERDRLLSNAAHLARPLPILTVRDDDDADVCAGSVHTHPSLTHCYEEVHSVLHLLVKRVAYCLHQNPLAWRIFAGLRHALFCLHTLTKTLHYPLSALAAMLQLVGGPLLLGGNEGEEVSS